MLFFIGCFDVMGQGRLLPVGGGEDDGAEAKDEVKTKPQAANDCLR